jgi:uncharacterized protein YbjT (DUF2867 family)
MKHTVLLAGASGEIGKRLTNNLIEDNSISEIHLLNRRPLGLTHEKVVEHIIDFEMMDELSFSHSFDQAFCCLGTTIKQAGSQQGFYQVDYTHCVNFAKFAAKHQCRNLSVISSLGANPKSNNFYLQTKGAMEEAMQSLDWQTLLIFRPSLLVGKRAEFRILERLGGYFLQLLAPLMIGPLKRYRPIQMSCVAKAMSLMTAQNKVTSKIIESTEINSIAKE